MKSIADFHRCCKQVAHVGCNRRGQKDAKQQVRGLARRYDCVGVPEQENLREHPRNGKVGCNRRGQKDAKQQVRGLRGNKTARGYPSRKTCERTREERTSVVTDADRKMQNSRCAV